MSEDKFTESQELFQLLAQIQVVSNIMQLDYIKFYRAILELVKEFNLPIFSFPDYLPKEHIEELKQFRIQETLSFMSGKNIKYVRLLMVKSIESTTKEPYLREIKEKFSMEESLTVKDLLKIVKYKNKNLIEILNDLFQSEDISGEEITNSIAISLNIDLDSPLDAFLQELYHFLTSKTDLPLEECIVLYTDYFEYMMSNLIDPILKENTMGISYNDRINTVTKKLKERSLEDTIGLFIKRMNGTLRNAFVHQKYYIKGNQILYYRDNPRKKSYEFFRKPIDEFKQEVGLLYFNKHLINIINGLRLSNISPDDLEAHLEKIKGNSS
ncbi:MAG: hypothetical protein ACFE9L_17520 [Candidatus Hodarchaeota archaeon]